MTDDSWDRILAEVMAHREAEVRDRSSVPLGFAAPIAWSVKQMGLTNGFSAVHRVGFPQHGEPYTACGERIRVPMYWLELTPALIRAMDRCRYCEAEISRAQREAA